MATINFTPWRGPGASCTWTESYISEQLHQNKEISSLVSNTTHLPVRVSHPLLDQWCLFPLPWYLYDKRSDPHSFDHLVPKHSKWGFPLLFFPTSPAHSSGTNRERWRLALLHNGWCTSSKEPCCSLRLSLTLSLHGLLYFQSVCCILNLVLDRVIPSCSFSFLTAN